MLNLGSLSPFYKFVERASCLEACVRAFSRPGLEREDLTIVHIEPLTSIKAAGSFSSANLGLYFYYLYNYSIARALRAHEA